MENKLIYVDINDFAKNANSYFQQAAAGVRIIVTIEGEQQYEVHTPSPEISSILSEAPRKELNRRQYDKLLDLLDPLDVTSNLP